MWENVSIMSLPTPLLDGIECPENLRGPPERALRRVAGGLRSGTISAPAVTAWHVGTGLGVIELTVALHHVCNTRRGRLARDVGHQAYPYKIHGVICEEDVINTCERLARSKSRLSRVGRSILSSGCRANRRRPETLNLRR
jgi:hypothetical protein